MGSFAGRVNLNLTKRMPRLILLILPLGILWFVFDIAIVHPAQGHGSRWIRHLDPGQEQILIDKKPGQRETLVNREVFSLSRLNESSLWGSRGRVGWSQETEAREHQERVELVWSQIDPQLLNQLSLNEQQELRAVVGRLTDPKGEQQPWRCWAPGTSIAKVEAYHQVEKLTGMVQSQVALFANQFLGPGRWGETALDGSFGRIQGRPTTLTWSLVPDGTETPGLTDEVRSFSNLRQWLTDIYGGDLNIEVDQQPWFSVVAGAFEDLAQTCGIRFVYEPMDDGASLVGDARGELGVRGDVRLAASWLDGEGDTLAIAFPPDRGDLILDSGDGTFDQTSFSSLRLHNTLTHELGHVLGLDHVCPLNETKLMEPILSLNYRGPQFDEYQSLQRQYGDFLEGGLGELDNDTSQKASVLSPLVGKRLEIARLSIDDDHDLDYFRVSLSEGQLLSLKVIPGEGAYAEGGGSCNASEVFDSTRIHDLRLELLGSDGRSVLASSFSGGLGENEEILNYKVTSDEQHFIKVGGGSANAAQLYQLNIEVSPRPSAPRLEVIESSIVEETGVVKNGWIDPGETVLFKLRIRNNGELPTTAMHFDFNVGENVRLFSYNSRASVLQPNEVNELEVILGVLGDCGAPIDFNIRCDYGGLLPLIISPKLFLGKVEKHVVIDESFDQSLELPIGWSSADSGVAESWRVSSQRFSSQFRSLFSEAVNGIGQSVIESPEFVIANEGAFLSFHHLVLLEDSYDGAVLEASRDGGDWFDLLTSEAVVLEGDYNAVIREGFGSSIGGRRAWSGQFGDFITTSVQVPKSWAGSVLRLRWLAAHDSSSSVSGWYLDDVYVETTQIECHQHRPELYLKVDESFLDESHPLQKAQIEISSVLPLMEPVGYQIQFSGTASRDDFQGELNGVFASGARRASIPIEVVSDQIIEGEETLVFHLVSGDGVFHPSGENRGALTLVDHLDFEAWLKIHFGELVPFDGDGDGDGASELEEYLLGSDPRSKQSKKPLKIVWDKEQVFLIVEDLPQRNDAMIEAQVSFDLNNWQTIGFTREDDGLRIPWNAAKGFVRLVFRLDQ